MFSSQLDRVHPELHFSFPENKTENKTLHPRPWIPVQEARGAAAAVQATWHPERPECDNG